MNSKASSVSEEIALYQRRSFSQFGEDGVLAWLFVGKRDGFYVDVGCHHPFRISNTASLHLDFGWRGINIDVDERAIAAFQKFRPGDINICSGVAGAPGAMEVTIFDEGAINTFSEASASHPAWAHIPRHKKIVAVDTLAALLSQHLPAGVSIDLMSVDAEGLDYEILSSNNWDHFKPGVLLVETDLIDFTRLSENQTHSLLTDHGYKLCSHVAVTSVYRLNT